MLARIRELATQPITVIIAGVFWLAVVCIGMKRILDYQSAPGAPAHAPALWPRLASFSRVPGRPTLVLLVHPHCACTRATMSELALLQARTRGQMDVVVLFVKPAGLDSAWARTSLWQEAAGIPGVRVILDRDAAEAQRFGAETSGQAILYDANGRLSFEGGITPGRGHAGDNAGSDAIAAFVRHGPVSLSTTPVYGCELASPRGGNSKGNPSCRR